MSALVHPHIVDETPFSQSRDSIADVYGPRTGYKGEWPERVDSRLMDEPERWVQSACVMCSNGCALDIGVKEGKIVGVRGRKDDRVNKGRLGPKGMHSWTANNSADRLHHPLIRKDGKLVPASWDEAMALIVSKTKETQQRLTQHGIGIYTTGQLFLEEYYALAVIGKAGLRSLHMDGNTRLCTATAAAAMRESFGSDGQPGSYADIDVTDCLFIVGHNVAATQTVLWSRILDRLAGPDPPKLIVIDPRTSTTARSATLHLAPHVGTNVAVLNGIQRLLIHNNAINLPFIHAHTIGYSELCRIVDQYTPDYVQQLTGIPAAQLVAAADIIGGAKSLLSTCLQGVYQSHQATAAACQINNINLLLGHIGRPGSGILQMNGQPTAQNNRECGCNGEYPAFRNNLNQKHMSELAYHWRVNIEQLPHWKESPTHIMEMLRMIEQGSMEMFWVIGTNPLVSLPELNRIRRLMTKPNLFLIVQDIFLTETAQIADVVLPAAMWAEKTGTFTNADRTVHISYQAIEPPGQARSDLDIFLSYAKQMDFRDKNGQPLLPFKYPREVFEAWKAVSAGRPCDYTGITYEKLTNSSGIQWPCNVLSSPHGTERLFTDWQFYTDMSYCETYGHDLETGTPYTADEYRQFNPAGRAFLKSCHYKPSDELPSDQYPYRLSTGRQVYHFHTRTKTGRDIHLAKAAGDAMIQMSAGDARRSGVNDDDMVVVESARGAVELRCVIGEIEDGAVFIPFHYGYWDATDERRRAANELTRTSWDPVSKQPLFKSGAVRVRPVAAPQQSVEIKQQQTDAMESAQHKDVESAQSAAATHRHRHLTDALLRTHAVLDSLTPVYKDLASRHQSDMEARTGLKVLLRLHNGVVERFTPIFNKHSEDDHKNAENRRREIERAQSAVVSALFPAGRGAGGVSESFALLCDMEHLWVVLQQLSVLLVALQPVAAAICDKEMSEAMEFMQNEVHRQAAWAKNKAKISSAQTLVVPVPVKS